MSPFNSSSITPAVDNFLQGDNWTLLFLFHLKSLHDCEVITFLYCPRLMRGYCSHLPLHSLPTLSHCLSNIPEPACSPHSCTQCSLSSSPTRRDPLDRLHETIDSAFSMHEPDPLRFLVSWDVVPKAESLVGARLDMAENFCNDFHDRRADFDRKYCVLNHRWRLFIERRLL